jgi:hypothetical protein
MVRPTFLVWLLLVGLAACETSPLPLAVPVTAERVTHRWLPGIEDGRTTVTSATAALGAPVAFDGGRVAVWRLLFVLAPEPLDDDALDDELDAIEYLWRNPYAPYRPVDLAGVAERGEELFVSGTMLPVGASPPPGLGRHALTREAEFHLVAVFGPDGVLRRHSLVQVGP